MIGPIHLGNSADTRHCYNITMSGYDCLCSKPTQLNQFAIKHINDDHPERQDWLADNIEAIKTAIATPELLYAELEYKPNMKHWTQCHAIRHPAESEDYLIVVLSLATQDGEESEFHQVVTVFPTKKRKFFYGSGDLRPKRRLYINKNRAAEAQF